LRDRAERAVRGSGIPDDLVALWQGTDGVDQRTARAVIDLAMRVGETLLSTGASASDVVATALRLTDAYGLRSVHVDVTFTSISVSYHRGPDADPMTVMRGITVRSTDFTRLERLQALVRDISVEPVEIELARARFARPDQGATSLSSMGGDCLSGRVGGRRGSPVRRLLVDHGAELRDHSRC